jgi:hypothetical protein
MRGKKWIGCLCVMAVMLLMASVAGAAERVPLRIARLPLQVQYGNADDEAINRIEIRLDRTMHVPLNDTLQAVKEIPGAQVEAALDEVIAQLQQTHKRVKLQDAMKPLADKLQADLVVCPVLNNYEQWTEMSWGWEHTQLLHSYVAMEIVGYDRSRDETFHRSASRYFDDEYSVAGLAENLSMECLDELTQSTDLRNRVNAWRLRLPK